MLESGQGRNQEPSGRAGKPQSLRSNMASSPGQPLVPAAHATPSNSHANPTHAKPNSQKVSSGTSSTPTKSDHPADAITEKRACVKCGYDLRGLTIGGRCSECGTIIRGVKSTDDSESINHCSMEFLRRLRTGAILAIAGLVAFLIALIFFRNYYGSAAMWPVGVITMGCAAVWVAGVYLLHTPRPERGETNHTHGTPALFWWILWNRWSQVGWLAVILVFMLSDSLKLTYDMQGVLVGGNPWLEAQSFKAGWILFAACTLGVFSTYIYLSWLSTWAGDDELSNRFRFSFPIGIFGIAIFGSLSWSLFSTTLMVGRIGPLSLTALGAAFVITVLISKNMFLAWVSFAQLMGWAVKNRETSMDIDAAMTAKIQARISENQSDKALGRAARGPRV